MLKKNLWVNNEWVYKDDDMMVVGDWAWRVTEGYLHSPYEGLWESQGNLPHVCVTEQFNDETPWPIAQFHYLHEVLGWLLGRKH